MSIMGLTVGQSVAALARKGAAPPTASPEVNPVAMPNAASSQRKTTRLFGVETDNGFSLTLLGPSGGSPDPAAMRAMIATLEAMRHSLGDYGA